MAAKAVPSTDAKKERRKEEEQEQAEKKRRRKKQRNKETKGWKTEPTTRSGVSETRR